MTQTIPVIFELDARYTSPNLCQFARRWMRCSGDDHDILILQSVFEFRQNNIAHDAPT